MKAKSNRHYTKTRSDAVLIFCAAFAGYVVAFKADSQIAETALSFAFITAMSVLGLYQTIGHFDMRTALKSGQEEEEEGVVNDKPGPIRKTATKP